MGRVYEAYYTKKGVYKIDKNGRPVIDENGKRVLKKFKPKGFTIEYTDARGRTVRRKGGRTEKQAEQALHKAIDNVQNEKNGFPTLRTGKILCDELATKYLAYQKRRVSPRHLDGLRQRLEAVLAGVRVAFVCDLTPDLVDEHLDTLEDDGQTNQTINKYLQAVKGMLTWAVKRRKLPYNPLKSVAKRSEDPGKHRALTEEECQKFLRAASVGPFKRAAISCKDGELTKKAKAIASELAERNVFIYSVLLQTGLRLGELKRLTWSDLNFEKKLLYCRNLGLKSRRYSQIPVSSALISILKEWKSKRGGEDSDAVVNVPSTILTTFDKDIELAKIAKKTHAGTAAIHSLRHTHGTRLNNMGADIKTVQALMRHSDPKTTLGIYIHSDRKLMARTIESLPEISAAEPMQPQKEATARTGTDDLPGGDDELPLRNRQGETPPSSNILSLKRVSAPGSPSSQAECREFEPLHPLVIKRRRAMA